MNRKRVSGLALWAVCVMLIFFVVYYLTQM